MLLCQKTQKIDFDYHQFTAKPPINHRMGRLQCTKQDQGWSTASRDLIAHAPGFTTFIMVSDAVSETDVVLQGSMR